ncbi:MAG: hypothetical protein A3F11_04940 [Gammaproteobacteria bacterium RIFCSPHIGHO2_12_FULL_37_14]|nr:MAG: hypothetical protein A3F11_04940 [Gammaproteobacteria bacterium RIFCSPHIGHO2_12_FULL_37_14]
MIIKKINHCLRNPSRWKRWIQDFILDMKFGSQFLGKDVYNANLQLGRSPSTNSDYEALSALFSNITILEDDVIVDIGCGKGRVFNFLLCLGLNNKLIGVDVDPKMVEFTKKRLRKYTQIDIHLCDVETDAIPDEGTIFYLFNPFSENIVKEFSRKLIDKISRGNFNSNKDRPLIIYYNSCYLNVFENNNFWKITKLHNISSMNLSAAIICPNYGN